MGTCPVYIQAGLLQRLGEFCAKHLADRRIAVIADDHVTRALPIPRELVHLTFPAGEASKSRDTWSALTDALLEQGFGRDSGIIAMGGGVTGDIAGFVAATYQRGVPWLQVPTTLLAMLDASVGGKTGVDTPSGKNLVGAFHQPEAVIMDPAALTSLPAVELRNGLAEAVKHAAIVDRAHFAWLETKADAILSRDPSTIEELLRVNVAIKAEVVQADEREAGRRAILNAGHSIGHAVEHASGFSLSHGEAVAIGLVIEARIGEALGISEAGTAAALAALLERFGLPVRIPRSLEAERVVMALRNDKKNRGKELRVVLLSAVGAVHGSDNHGWTTPVPESLIMRVCTNAE
jgi:3-dehydroquinate synthase